MWRIHSTDIQAQFVLKVYSRAYFTHAHLERDFSVCVCVCVAGGRGSYKKKKISIDARQNIFFFIEVKIFVSYCLIKDVFI